MNKETIKKIFEVLGAEYNDNFDRYKVNGYTLANYTTIPFYTRTVHTRKINDWGTDEDTDIYLCYFKEGWKFGKMITQVGAGVQKIIDDDISAITIETIVEWFEEQDIIDQMKIIAEAFDILKSAGKLDKLNVNKVSFAGDVREF